MDLSLIIKEQLERFEIINRIDLYKEKGATDNIIELLNAFKQLNNIKKIGCFMEGITKALFGFEDSFNSEHDFIYQGEDAKKIELKSSSMLLKDLRNNKETFQYNSIRLDYDYDYLMLCNIHLTELKYYIVDKHTFLEHIKSLNLKQKKLQKGIVELITFKRLKPIMIEVVPTTFKKMYKLKRIT